MSNAFDTEPKEIIGGPITIGDDNPVTKYRANDGRTFWAYNGMEVFYEDERMYDALDTITELKAKVEVLEAKVDTWKTSYHQLSSSLRGYRQKNLL